MRHYTTILGNYIDVWGWRKGLTFIDSFILLPIGWAFWTFVALVKVFFLTLLPVMVIPIMCLVRLFTPFALLASIRDLLGFCVEQCIEYVEGG